MPSIAISVSSAGDTTLVAAPGAAKFIRVTGFSLMGAGTVDATLKSGSTSKAGPYPLTNGGGIRAAGPPPDGVLFDCALNEALVLTTGGATRVSGDLEYVIEG